MAVLRKSVFVGEVKVTDPDTQGEVTLEVYKHENGSMFAIDSSFIEYEFEEEETPMISDPFNNDSFVELVDFEEE